MESVQSYLKMAVGDMVQVGQHPDHPKLAGRVGIIDTIFLARAGELVFEHIHVQLEATRSAVAMGRTFKYGMLLTKEYF